MLNIVERKESKLYTGLHDFKIVAINPTAAEIAELTGREDVKEPEYGGFTEEGEAKLRVDIWLKSDTLLTKKAFFLEDKLSKNQWINDKGVFTSSNADPGDNPKMEWFTKNNHRLAYVGEVDIYNFLVNWFDMDQRAESSLLILDTPWTDLVKGDLSEIKEFMYTFAKRGIRVLLGVKDGKYQDIYNKVFTPEGSGYVKGYQSQLSKDAERGYPWKSNYQNSFKFQEYSSLEPEAALTTSTEANKESVAELLNNLD